MDADTTDSVSEWIPTSLLFSRVPFLPCLALWILVCLTISHPLSFLFQGPFHILNNNSLISCFKDRFSGLSNGGKQVIIQKKTIQQTHYDFFQTTTNDFLLFSGLAVSLGGKKPCADRWVLLPRKHKLTTNLADVICRILRGKH